MSKPLPFLPPSLLSLIFLFLLSPVHLVHADPAVVPFQDCFGNDNLDNKFRVDTIYAQVLKNEEVGNYLNLTVFGSSPTEIVGLTNASSSLATIFVSTSILTLNAWTNASYLCQNMRPPSPLPVMDTGTFSYCPMAAGPFAFSSTIPWGNNRELTTLNTRLRAVDPFGKELVCVDVATTPLDPKPHAIYGRANIIMWSTVGLTIAYWVVVGIARIVSAWNRGISRPGRGLWSRAQSAGFILASAISGERLGTSPALMRFCTPSMRDVVFHTQWCALLGMVAVEWPQFIYPLLTQTAWSTLSFNTSLTSDARQHHWNPLTTPLFDPPSGYADQVTDIASPLYIDPSVPNIIFTLPSNATHGISSFANTLGIRPQDLWSTCIILFLSIIAVTITASALVWFLDVVVTSILETISGQGATYGPGTALNRLNGARSPVLSTQTKEVGGTGTGAESPTLGASAEESKPLTNGNGGNLGFGLALSASKTNGGLSSSPSGEREQRDRGYPHRSWWCFRFRSDIGSFHGNVLHGNLVRILVWFHLPITVFSCYQMTLPHSITSTTSTSLAALSFVIFSLLIPAHLVIRVTFTTTNKLYDETRTLLSLGPLYNHYRHGSQLFASLLFATNIAFGVTIGAGQKSGTAQAIVILVVEVISALVTSIWLPWGSGASMGLISFLFCVARIVVAVLLVILTPTISVGAGPGGWVAYGILLILALVYLALFLMILVKLLESVVRIIGGIGFDRSRHVVDSGLIGACGLLGCCGLRSKKRSKNKRTKGSSGVKSPLSGRASTNMYKATELGESPTSITGGGIPNPRRNSDLSSYNPPAAFLSNHSDHGSVTPPRFLGGADSRKGSTHSQPPSVLRPEHANQPYREETDQDWWMENEDQGGAFIMGAWQPFGAKGNQPRQSPNVNVASGYTPLTGGEGVQQQQQQQAFTSLHQPQPKLGSALGNTTSSSTPSATPTTGFSRVGGGRAHIDSPYSITTGGNNHPLGNAQSGSTHTFPSIGQQSTTMLVTPTPPPQPQYSPSPLPYQAYTAPQPARQAVSPVTSTSHTPPSISYSYSQPPTSFINDEDEPPVPLSRVRQAQPASVAPSVQSQQQQAELGTLPPGAMPPAHIRTKSQTAIIEDAGGLLYGSHQGGPSGTSASQSGISARLSLPPHASLQPLMIPSSQGSAGASSSSATAMGASMLHPPPSAPAMFTLHADGDDDEDDADSTVEDQQQKKRWYHLRKKRPHSTDGRTTATTPATTTTTTTSASNNAVPLPLDQEFGATGGGSAAGDGPRNPQRSFVVIRKPVGSMGRLSQAVATAAAEGSGQPRSATSPRSRSRPPTR